MQKTIKPNKHCHHAQNVLITQDIMDGPLTMSKALSKSNAHSWQTTIKAEFLSLKKNKTWNLHHYLKKGKQLTPNGHLKSKQKLMAKLTNTMFVLSLMQCGYY